MTVPLDAIRAIHNAFRKDLAAMDVQAAESARGRGDQAFVAARCGFFIEILAWHAEGEEAFVFPALEGVAPLVSEAYDRDHRGLDRLSAILQKAAAGRDALALARETAAFHFFLGHHLAKEEAHLYRIFNERIPLPEQGPIIGRMAQKIPSARFPETVGWLFPLLGPDDRENMIRIWKMALPEPVFAGALQLIRASIGAEFAELALRIPEIA
jgi:hypothetical protein